jgi:hypothetical protein
MSINELALVVKEFFITVILPSNVSFLCCQLFSIALTSLISLREALECFESFYKVSGLKMNSSKTKAVWVGNKKY